MAKKNRDELLKVLDGVKGFLSDKEAYFLYDRAFGLKKGATIVEIGSFCGRSTVALGTALKDSGNLSAKIYAIDTFGGSSEHGAISTFETFSRNISTAGVSDLVIPVKSTSEMASRDWEVTRNIDMLWIDGGHEYEFAAQDINLWLMHVSVNGTIALHDTSGQFRYGHCMGVRRALKEYLFTRESLKDYGFVDSITYAVKVHTMTPDDYLRTRIAYLCWWSGETASYSGLDGLKKAKLFFSIPMRYFKNIPRSIRKPWLILKRR